MNEYIGDFPSQQTIYHAWSSFAGDGSSITRATNGTVQVYKNDDATSEVTTGVTDTEDFDSKTGIHMCKIVTSDAFYATGQDYQVMLIGAVIDGKTVNVPLFSFSIENRNIKANLTQINGSAIILALFAAMVAGGVKGTASGVPTTTTMPASDLPSTHDDQYFSPQPGVIIWTSGVLVNVKSTITDYVGSSKTLSFEAVHTAPTAGDTFVIV